MNKRMKIILSILIIVAITFSGVVWASNNNIYIGISDAMSFGGFALFEGEEEDPEDPEDPEEPGASEANVAWNEGYDAGYAAAVAGENLSLPERRWK